MPSAGDMVTTSVRLVRLLGEGGMGSVWLAEHVGLETSVAVKFISAEIAREPAVIDRFRREAKLAAAIRDPHVVHIYDSGVTEAGAPFIVMELLEGESLSQRLERAERVAPADASVIVAQVAGALAKAHSLGIVHRDLKPHNLFLVPVAGGLFTKILDFGIAKRVQPGSTSTATHTGAMLGTPAYMGPEQLLSAKDVDHTADLWALAVIAYQMVTGCLPFEGETMTALSLAICNGQFPKPSERMPELASSIDAFFARALARDPERRFRTSPSFSDAFADACAGRVGAWAPPSWGGATRIPESEVDPNAKTRPSLPTPGSSDPVTPSAPGPSARGSAGLSAASLAGAATTLPGRPARGPWQRNAIPVAGVLVALSLTAGYFGLRGRGASAPLSASASGAASEINSAAPPPPSVLSGNASGGGARNLDDHPPTFDETAAASALAKAAQKALECGTLRGSAGVLVTFAPSGAAAEVRVVPPVGGTSLGACIAKVFRGATVPPFSGAAATRFTSFAMNAPPPPPAAPAPGRCANPYVIDARGIKHLKPECL